MATLHPFRATRPVPATAPRIAAVPYDVVNTEEARALAADNPLSFLHVSRAEIDLPAGADPYADAVYARAVRNFEALEASALVVEETPSVYLYRLRAGGHEQTGIAACFGLDEYDANVIKKHERTRRDKEDDRTRHMLALEAQTGPVFLVYRARADIDGLVSAAAALEPLIDFEADDGVRHTLWRTSEADRDSLVAAARRIPALYIADGHHRAASAARARTELAQRAREARGPGGAVDPGNADNAGNDGAAGGPRESATFLAVAFPDNQVQILPYNRTVNDLAGLSPAAFLDAVRERFVVQPGPAAPARRGDVAMYFDGAWQTLRPRTAPDASDTIASLDVTILQDRLLEPVLKIADVRSDPRIGFVGGGRGTGELERLVASGQAAVAFALYPVGVDDLMKVSDAGAIMPPKSTWFEPKLRDGLLIHDISNISNTRTNTHS
jgi:uncharacterized protein (DUF1015 family)